MVKKSCKLIEFFAGIVIVFVKNWYKTVQSISYKVKIQTFFHCKKAMKPVLCNYKKKSFMNGSIIQDLLFVLRRSKLFVILNIQRHILNNYASLTEGTLTTMDESFASPLFKDAATSVSKCSLLHYLNQRQLNLNSQVW